MRIIDWNMAKWRNFPLEAEATALWWLGQAGFAVRYGGRSFLIDPYLSNSLAEKYKDAEFKHVRMMPAPIDPEADVRLTAIPSAHEQLSVDAEGRPHFTSIS